MSIGHDAHAPFEAIRGLGLMLRPTSPGAVAAYGGAIVLAWLPKVENAWAYAIGMVGLAIYHVAKAYGVVSDNTKRIGELQAQMTALIDHAKDREAAHDREIRFLTEWYASETRGMLQSLTLIVHPDAPAEVVAGSVAVVPDASGSGASAP